MTNHTVRDADTAGPPGFVLRVKPVPPDLSLLVSLRSGSPQVSSGFRATGCCVSMALIFWQAGE